MHKALITLLNGKSPGPNGLPKEFYVKYWALVKGPITTMINHSRQAKNLSLAVSVGLISLLVKSRM